MANVLFLTGDIGPAEGSVYSNLKNGGHDVTVYNVAGRWITGKSTVPLWMKGYNTRHSPLARNWFKRAIGHKEIDATISSGLQAASFAANTFGGNYYPLLWRGDLDFSNRNTTQKHAFGELVRTSDRLLLEDSWEMDKAIAKNSQVTHLRMRYPSLGARKYLTSMSGNVAIIYPHAQKNAADVLQEATQEFLRGDAEVGLVDIKTLFSARDLEEGKDFSDTLAERLERFSYAIILGTGPHHSTVLRALIHDKAQIVVDQTVGMAFLSDELDIPHRARGLGCVQTIRDLIEISDVRRPSEIEPRTAIAESDYLNDLVRLWQRDYNSCFEELPGVVSKKPLNIYFSVGMVQDSTKGARHQRVRNMHDAFSKRQALNIFGEEPFVERRLKLANDMLIEGRSAGVFYGENSTSPMPRKLSDQLAKFLEIFTDHGGRSMWFVRDLHWLETFEESPWTDERATELRSDGLNELREVGDRAQMLAAPSLAAGEGFNSLLVSAGERPRNWHPVPPAVQPQNIVDDESLALKDGITLLYAGGVSEIYQMELYLTALRNLEIPTMMDFVVRKPEAERLEHELERHDLLETDRTRILHTTMDLYRPRTSRTLGMVLLDSSYARFAFPYKTVTMIERGYPILCYKDMGIAEFVESNDLGIAVERSAIAIRKGISSLIRNGAEGIERVRKYETWENRVHGIYRALA
jgi:hypothetical protein